MDIIGLNKTNLTEYDRSGQNGLNRTKVDIMGTMWIEKDRSGWNRTNVDQIRLK